MGQNFTIRPYQACRSTEGWTPVFIESASTAALKYRVDVNPWGTIAENICECPAYIYRGKCKHQQMASESICGWSDESDAYRGGLQQNDQQRKERVCPRCGGPTRWEMEIEE